MTDSMERWRLRLEAAFTRTQSRIHNCGCSMQEVRCTQCEDDFILLQAAAHHIGEPNKMVADKEEPK